MSIKLTMTLDAKYSLYKRIQSSDVLLERVNKLMRQRAHILLGSIQEDWPVDTGYSRANWSAVKKGPVQFQVTNPVHYAIYVHRKGKPRDKTVWNTEIRAKKIPQWENETQRALTDLVRSYINETLGIKGG